MGQHFQSDDIAYGDALLEAVSLNESGKPPRVVIGSSVESKLLKQLSAYRGEEAPHYDVLLEDPSDNSLFVDYLGVAFEHFNEELFIDYELLASHRNMVCKGLKEYESDASIRQKYTWLAAYHNYVCRTFAERLMVASYEGVGPEELDLESVAENVLQHIVQFDCHPVLRPLDSRRLEHRLTTVKPSSHRNNQRLSD